MRRLPYVIISLFFAANLFAQSPHGKDLKYDCSDCHSSVSWKEIPKEIKFDHNDTAFKLSGQHKSVSCVNCHQSLVFSNKKDDCSSCHKNIHQNSVSPECSSCHTTQTWLITNINELHQRSRFPLVGVHATQDCAQCHTKFSTLNFEVRGIECIDCHRVNYMAAKNPDHYQSGFSTDCQQCHLINQTNWSSSSFEHGFFPLVGGHSIKDCFSCHQQGNFTGLSQDCYSCHKQNYEATTNPNHIQGKFSTNCVSCHTINGWSPGSFDHNATSFSLLGMHITLSCNSCHSKGYTNLPLECYGCHKPDYDKTVNPDHVTNKFPTTCEQCHSPNGWTPSTFDHNATAFPLTGAHVNVNCGLCHTIGYTGISTDCYNCHKTNYDNATNPNHLVSNYPTICEQCHTTNAWTPSTFDHNATAFPLSGAHTNVDCGSCHITGYTGTPTDCYSCHKTNYDNTVNPNHVTNNFPPTCEQCHSVNGWVPSTFDHNTTAFPLTGVHVNVNCTSCHTTGYIGTSTDCYSCHKTNYDNTTNPNHLTSQFPTTCEQCHTTTGWTPSTFNHNNTAFPLTGKHTTVDCISCHTTGYIGTSTDCYSCHKTNYDNTTNPNHIAASFPTVCDQCHTTNGWTPATFDHDNQYFPIYSGNHSGEWNTCADCHTNANNYAVFSCIDCHEHNKQDTDNDHNNVSNYVYASSSCYSCHPRGSE